MSNFQKYSVYYDLLYRDKNYDAEAEYVARAIRSAVPDARSILEFGSGTGRHGRLLAEKGFDVHGIERSQDMVVLAKMAAVSPSSRTTGAFTCEVGDICKVNMERTFDAVISLFHVISYQTTNEALQAAFRVAANHLEAGGVYLSRVAGNRRHIACVLREGCKTLILTPIWRHRAPKVTRNLIEYE